MRITGVDKFAAAELGTPIHRNGENENWVGLVARRGFGVAEELHGAQVQLFQVLVVVGVRHAEQSLELGWSGIAERSVSDLVWEGGGEKGLAVWNVAGLKVSGKEGLEK
jgi:hypothetical protein